MLERILQDPNFIFYLLAVEGIILCILQLRCNLLLRKSLKGRSRKAERAKELREEVKRGNSQIPVTKFQNQTAKETPEKGKKGGYDEKEVAVLQEMMAEFFG